ncbi:MAG: hypothetical protein H6767_03575 [Candidatus Peribacteria bacterium]|nr:MAG: hypothetical protein H6767_03575 [Candidatus Peribacteria bacterium]
MFCCNQVNASYKVFNKQYTKEEYEVIAADVRKKISTHAGYAEVKKQFESFIRTYFVAQGLNGSRCEKVVGENVYNSKNCVNCYTMTAMENGVNALQVGDTQDDVMKNILNSIETGTFCHDVIGSCSFGGYVSDVYFSF